ncbi:phage tail protein [Sedimenticola selenatireducens]|uniref:phage tail protein n=1 Tax=Sedimenticola selenatireducens TaxID=191960 RepID=UPI0016424920|nr:phage tail protein [Sedimenticola selenatireducens]
MYGTARIAGNVIWSGGIQETSHTQDVGGKGGSSASHTTYTYSCSFSVGICEGEITGIRRIWADSVLIYNKGDTATADELAVSNQNGITVYTGSETQEPDPTIEAAEGMGNVPAFRGLAHVVFDTFQLENYGNRIPNFTFEVVGSGYTSHQIDSLNDYTVDGEQFEHIGIPYADNSGFDVIDYQTDYLTYATVHKKKYSSEGVMISDTSESLSLPVYSIGTIRYSQDYEYILRVSVSSLQYLALNSGNVLLSPPAGTNQVLAAIRYYPTDKIFVLWIKNTSYTSYVLKEYTSAGSPTGREYIGSKGANIRPGLCSNQNGSIFVTGATDASTDVDVDAIDALTMLFDKAWQVTAQHMSSTVDSCGGHSFDVNADNIIFYKDQNYYIAASKLSDNGAVVYIGNVPSIGSDQYDSVTCSGSIAYTKNGSAVVSDTVGIVNESLADVIVDICSESGVHELSTNTVTDEIYGYVRSGVMSSRSALEPLLSAYQISAVESDYKLKFSPLTGTSSETIVDDDLAADISITRALETELPRRVTLAYADKDADYLPAVQSAQRIKSAGQIVNEISQQFSLSTDGDHMSQLSEKILYRAWTERESFDWSLTTKHAYLDAGDVVTLENGGFNHITRITSNDQQLPGLINCGGVATRASVYSSNLTGAASSYTTQTLVLVGNTLFEILDLPALRDADATTAGYYVAVYGQKTNWTSGIVYKSIDSGASWSGLITTSTEATMGITTNVLPDADAKTWDMTSTVNISMHHGTLASDTVENVLNGANAALIGNELIHFTTRTLEGDGTYTLSGLLRGRIGTEHETGNHAIGDRFVLLNTTSIYRVSSEYSQKGVTNKFKAVTNGQYLESVTNTTDVTFDNLNSKPLSVCQISGTRDGSNNLTINWLRRSRLSGVSLDDPALGEQSELYEVHIMDGAVVKRVIQAATNSADYTASQQTLDGFTPGDPITVNIYQVSATVGRGYVRSETL